MLGILTDGFNGFQIKALYIQDGFKIPFVRHIYQISGDSAHAEASLDVVFFHHLLHILRNSQGRTAGSCLEGKSVF